MNISARFNQAPEENRRYLLDYTLQLASGEILTSVVANQITSLTDPSNIGAFAINTIAIAPSPSLQCAYFATGGSDQTQYAVQFLATTSLGQVLEDVVIYNIQEKLDP